jgi:hypothetical protein
MPLWTRRQRALAAAAEAGKRAQPAAWGLGLGARLRLASNSRRSPTTTTPARSRSNDRSVAAADVESGSWNHCPGVPIAGRDRRPFAVRPVDGRRSTHSGERCRGTGVFWPVLLLIRPPTFPFHTELATVRAADGVDYSTIDGRKEASGEWDWRGERGWSRVNGGEGNHWIIATRSSAGI